MLLESTKPVLWSLIVQHALDDTLLGVQRCRSAHLSQQLRVSFVEIQGLATRML